MTPRSLEIAAISIVGTLALCGDAIGQPTSRFYVGGSVGALKVSADAVTDTSPAAGLVVGVALLPWLDVEADIVIPTERFTRSYTGISTSFAPLGSSLEEIERLGVTTRFDKERDVRSSISGALIFHPAIAGRWTPGFVVGVMNHHVRDVTRYTPIAIPPGVDPSLPSVRAHEESGSRNIGGPTVGVNLAIAVTRQLVVVPDFRYDYGSIGDEINNGLRSSIRILWRF